jgi:predicted CXXCH cytochrome family protein
VPSRLILGVILAACLVGLFLLGGCSPITRHKVLSTVFDGVPSLPPPQEFCEDYAAKAVASLRNEMEGKNKPVGETTNSSHPPYDEKKCDSCHNKTTNSGFVVGSKNELCFVCHIGFGKGAYVHGPVAVGDCLACHDPHTAQQPRLLKTRPADICTKCHKEKRQAESLHTLSSTHGLICVNCHNPHAGNVHFFLK